MQATVIKAFPGRPDNDTKVRTIKVGEVIDGDLAKVAVKEGWARAGVAQQEGGKKRRGAESESED